MSNTEEEKTTKKKQKVATDEGVVPSSFDDYEPSVTSAVFVYWILPIVVLVFSSRFMADPFAMAGIGIGELPYNPRVPKNNNNNNNNIINNNPPLGQAPTPLPTTGPTPRSMTQKKPTPLPSIANNKPTSYKETVQAIHKRRLNWDETDASATKITNEHSPGTSTSSPTTTTRTTSTSTSTSSKTKPRDRSDSKQFKPRHGASSDPERQRLLDRIDGTREQHEADPDNLFKLIELADMLRMYDVNYHDGGTTQREAIQQYKTAISMALKQREAKLERGEETASESLNDERGKSYSVKSIDGILCSLYTNLGKIYFMANMFDLSEGMHNKALELEPLYLDAVSSRGSTRTILGDYEGAAKDFTLVMERDDNYAFLDVFTGLAKILNSRESAVPGGWQPMLDKIDELLPMFEQIYQNMDGYGEDKPVVAKAIKALLYAQFMYHDSKTKDTDQAWNYLSKAYQYKMDNIAPYNVELENQKTYTTKKIFTGQFWPKGVGSQSMAPIFIIGFPRCGSTLLERVLDAHPLVIGTGENSVFNGQLDKIRNKIVDTSLLGDGDLLSSVIASLADGVVQEMRDRWLMGSSRDQTKEQNVVPARFTDKMLMNFNNVGFIHLLFPNALILHIFREPMDTVFSAYKHEFPAGNLDYTSDFVGLANMYNSYRDMMDHWDKELPGRVTHVRYEDMVHDMPGIARKVIEAADLEWDDSILDFHKKKHAVNTLSTMQVRKGVYKDSLLAWKRYEQYIGALVKLVGKRTVYDVKTSLPGYVRPPPTPPEEKENDEEEEAAAAAVVDQETHEEPPLSDSAEVSDKGVSSTPASEESAEEEETVEDRKDEKPLPSDAAADPDEAILSDPGDEATPETEEVALEETDEEPPPPDAAADSDEATPSAPLDEATPEKEEGAADETNEEPPPPAGSANEEPVDGEDTPAPPAEEETSEEEVVAVDQASDEPPVPDEAAGSDEDTPAPPAEEETREEEVVAVDQASEEPPVPDEAAGSEEDTPAPPPPPDEETPEEVTEETASAVEEKQEELQVPSAAAEQGIGVPVDDEIIEEGAAAAAAAQAQTSSSDDDTGVPVDEEALEEGATAEAVDEKHEHPPAPDGAAGSERSEGES